MVLRGVTNGQRVPEDWERANAHQLISTSMRAPAKSAFDPKATDLNFFFSHSPDTITEGGLAAGLHSFTPQAELRMLAVVSQGNAGSGLETLWQICASLQRLGYPVVVLDGTAQETDNSPGLLHLLQHASWNDGAQLNLGATASSLAVIPAAKGLQHLSRKAGDTTRSPMEDLLPYFRTYGLMVIHAPASTLGPLLTHTATVPLVVMGGGSAGVMTSYKSLKQIALHTGLPCMVAALLHSNTASERRKAPSQLMTLQACAE
eukprot:gene54905-73348_t